MLSYTLESPAVVMLLPSLGIYLQTQFFDSEDVYFTLTKAHILFIKKGGLFIAHH